MNVHVWTSYDIAQSRHEERLARAMAAHHALRASEERTAAHCESVKAARQVRLLDRLLRRKARLGESAPAEL